jgi:transposase
LRVLNGCSHLTPRHGRAPVQRLPPPRQLQLPGARQAQFVICDETIECGFKRLKQYRRVATRYEKLAVNSLAMVTIAAILMWLWL